MWQALAAGVVGGAMKVGGGLLAGSPDVPDWVDITPEGVQGQAIGSNLKSLPELQKLATQTNTFNQAELQRMLEASIPGYKTIMAKGSDIIQSQLGGELSESELKAMRRNEAAYGAGAGVSGTDFLAKKTLRDLGLGTLERQQAGLNNAQSWIRNSAAITTPQLFNMTSMFLTPEAVFRMDMENQAMKFNRDWMENQLDWGSDWKTLTGQAISEMGSGLMSIGSFGMGAGGGGGGGVSSMLKGASAMQGAQKATSAMPSWLGFGGAYG